MTKHDSDKIALRYKKECFIAIDVAGDDNYLHRSIIKSDLIPYSDYIIFRSEVTSKIKQISKNRSSAEALTLFDYYTSHQHHCGITIYDYVESLMEKDSKWALTFVMMCVSVIYNVRIISLANLRRVFGMMETYHSLGDES